MSEIIRIEQMDYVHGEKIKLDENDTHWEIEGALNSFPGGDKRRITQYISDLYNHDRSTVQIKQDGSVTIKPATTTTTAAAESQAAPSLPNEVLDLIMFHIDQQSTLFHCCLINRQFYSLANLRLWTTVHLDRSDISERFLTSLEICVEHQRYQQQQHRRVTGQQLVRSLYLNDDYWWESTFSRLLPHLRHLTHLRIGNRCGINGVSSLVPLPFYCQQLQSLELTGISLSESFLVSLGRQCRQLTSLVILECHDIPSDLFLWLEACPLTSIRLSYHIGNNNDDNNNIHPLPSRVLTYPSRASLQRFHGLTVLDFKGVSWKMVQSILVATNATRAWPHLRKLRLSPCTGMNDAFLVYCLKSHPELTCVAFSSAERLTDHCLRGISVCLPKLTELELDGVTQLTPTGLFQWLRNDRILSKALTSVHLTNCGLDVTANGDHAFPEGSQPHHVQFERHHLHHIRQSAILATGNNSGH